MGIRRIGQSRSPDEFVWNDLRNHGTGRKLITSLSQLRQTVVSHIRQLQKLSDLVRSFFSWASYPVCTRIVAPILGRLIPGTQCLKTPEGMTVAHAGDPTIVPEGPPMALNSVGDETRRSVFLVPHDTTKPWITMASDWQPKGLCPK